MTSPMQRTLKYYADRDIMTWKTEYYNYFAKKRVDLLHIIDLLAFDGKIIGVQVFGSDVGSHKKKIMEKHWHNTFTWLDNGGSLVCHGWRKLKKKRGKKATFWKPRIINVTLSGGELFWEEED